MIKFNLGKFNSAKSIYIPITRDFSIQIKYQEYPGKITINNMLGIINWFIGGNTTFSVNIINTGRQCNTLYNQNIMQIGYRACDIIVKFKEV